MEVINENQPRKLYRSRSKKIAGVCQGLANYLGLDVTLVRVLAVITIFLGSLGFWIYLLLWIVMPLEPVQINRGV